MREPIVLYVWQREGQEPVVYDREFLEGTGVEEALLLAASGGALTRHAIVFKEPLCHAQQQEVERACLTDATERAPAMIDAYVARWTFPVPATAAGFRRLAPNVADRVSCLLHRELFPSMGDPDFFALLNRLRGAPSRPSKDAASVPCD